MQRITGDSVDPDLHGNGKDGFREGSPGITSPTLVTQEWLNAHQEEAARLVEKAIVQLNPASNEQMHEAVEKMASLMAYGAAVSSHVSRTAPAAVNYTGVAFAEGVFVATSDGASCPHTSIDGGVTWVSRSVTALNDVCHGSTSSRFLGVGPAGALVTSEDGLATWTARTPAGAYADTFECCATDGTMFLAAGENGEIQTSANGTTGWTQRTPAGGFNGTWFGAAYGYGGRWMLVGIDNVDEIHVQYSTNSGVTWTARTPSELNGGVYGVAFGGELEDVWIAVGLESGIGPSLIMRSVDDGLTWENITAPNGHETGYSSVYWDGENFLFIAVGADGGIAISRDGSEGSWRDLSRPSYTPTLNGVVVGDKTCVLVGNTSALRQSLVLPWSS